MKREIKFRAWDIEDKKYYEPIHEAYKGKLMDLSVSFAGELIRRTLSICAEHESMFPDKYILEQYTGLKDKNGKEVYEGDHFGEPNYPVVFADGAFWNEGELLRDSLHLEIIGNIHQNKDLIK